MLVPCDLTNPSTQSTVALDVRQLAQLDAEKAQLVVFGDGKVLKMCPLMGLYPSELPFIEYLEPIKAEAHWIEQYHYCHWEQTGDLF